MQAGRRWVLYMKAFMSGAASVAPAWSEAAAMMWAGSSDETEMAPELWSRVV